MGLHIKYYSSSKYILLINSSNGFMARLGANKTNPSHNCETPEMLDISITNYCDLHCSYCYRKYNKNTHHMLLDEYHTLIEQAAEIGVVQVALGGGNPNQHPDFIDILKLTKGYGISPSYSTNGFGMTESIIDATKKYCGAVAISYHGNMDEIMKTVKRFTNKGIKTNLHFILDAQTVYKAIDIMQNTPSYWNDLNAVVFLNMKPVDKDDHNLLQNANPDVLKQFFYLTKKTYNYKIGFDSCTISFLMQQGYNRISSCIEPCEAAKFSAFVSEDMKMYPCSFMINGISGGNLNARSIKDIWINEKIFKEMRNRVCKCLCEYSNLCMGGCPIYDINDKLCHAKLVR